MRMCIYTKVLQNGNLEDFYISGGKMDDSVQVKTGEKYKTLSNKK